MRKKRRAFSDKAVIGRKRELFRLMKEMEELGIGIPYHLMDRSMETKADTALNNLLYLKRGEKKGKLPRFFSIEKKKRPEVLEKAERILKILEERSSLSETRLKYHKKNIENLKKFVEKEKG